MTIRLSTSLRNAIVGYSGFAAAFSGATLEVRTGTQPATADAADTGTLLGTVTLSSGAYTPETPASQTITISGTSGSVDTVTVGTVNIIPQGSVAFDTDTTTTAAALRDAIIRNGLYKATSSGAVVTVIAPAGTGDMHNGLALSTTTTTLTATSGGNIAGGVSAVNGLKFSAPSAGSISKLGVWSFTGIAVGTAGHFRIKASASDAGGVDSTATYPRMDGSIATSGADMNLSNLSITVGAPTTIDTLTVTMPAQ